MKIIDLTQTFIDNMPVYPGDPPSSLKQIAYFEKDGFNDHEVKTAMHVGTHMDAPFHMVANGKKVDEIDPEKFIGNGILIDASDKASIDSSVLKNNSIESGSIVLIYTGFGKKYENEGYFNNSPRLTEDFAQRMLDLQVKMIRMDMASPDREPFPIHKILLGQDILLLENLTNLDKLIGVKKFEVIALPAKFAADAAPARVIARIEE